MTKNVGLRVLEGLYRGPETTLLDSCIVCVNVASFRTQQLPTSVQMFMRE